MHSNRYVRSAPFESKQVLLLVVQIVTACVASFCNPYSQEWLGGFRAEGSGDTEGQMVDSFDIVSSRCEHSRCFVGYT